MHEIQKLLRQAYKTALVYVEGASQKILSHKNRLKMTESNTTNKTQ